MVQSNLLITRAQEIGDEIASCAIDNSLLLDYLIEQGKNATPTPKSLYQKKNLVLRCVAQTWIAIDIERDRVQIIADSKAIVTRGLIALLSRLFNQATIDEVVQFDLPIAKKWGIDRLIGTQRRMGFQAMINTIQTRLQKNKIYGKVF